MQTIDQDRASESRARRAAKRVGLLAKKSRRRRNSSDNLDGFALIEPLRNIHVLGERFELTAQDVIEFCASYGQRN